MRVFGAVLRETSSADSEELGTRINELSNKSTQLLLFLTFAILAAVTLMTKDCDGEESLIRAATRWWMCAVFPVLLGVLPVKDFHWNKRKWYRLMIHAKCVCLWASVILSGIGAIQFLRALR
jgi:hypothetical protein